MDHDFGEAAASEGEDVFASQGASSGGSPRRRGSGKRGARGTTSSMVKKGATKPGGKRGAKAAGVSRPGKEPCLNCGEKRVANSRWCKMHKRSADALDYQMESQNDEELKRVYQEAMKDDVQAKEEVDMFSRENPPDAKYARKKLMDWVRFTERRGRRTSTTDRDADLPMTEQEFVLWCKNVKGLTDAEATSWWTELRDNASIDRDFGGFRGRPLKQIRTGCAPNLSVFIFVFCLIVFGS